MGGTEQDPSGSVSSPARSTWVRVCGYLCCALVPPLHIAVLSTFWSEYNVDVDRRSCSCSCWDTVFKGTYERGVAGYKHVYFNATLQTAKMWLLTVTAVVVLYEGVSRTLTLFLGRRLRTSMLVLFVVSLFPHYFTWWVILNYWNDDFYAQWNHQMFFSLTELLSTVLVFRLLDAQRPVTTGKALGISGVAFMHVLLGSFDQFVQNVVRGHGDLETVIRDLGLMLPDLLHVVIPLVELARNKTFRLRSPEFRRELGGVLVMVAVGFLVCCLL